MHEGHLVQKVVEQVLDKVARGHAQKVKSVQCALGELLGFDEGSIRLYFEDFTKGTVLEGTALIIRHIKPKLQCKACSFIFDKNRHQFECPQCHSMALSVQSGKEFYFECFEVE